MSRPHSALLAAALVAAAGLAPSLAESDDLDLVFVVDSSNSMKNNDPEGLRTQICGAVADFLRGEEGVRVSVVQFAGWNETPADKVVVMSREKPSERVSAAVQSLTAFGDASDLNVALERGLLKILDDRGRAGAKGPVWFVVLTDGDFQVIEDKVRPEYEAIAKAEFAQERKNVALSKAALKIAEKTIASPALRGAELRVHGINFGKADVPKESAFQKVVDSGAQKGRILNVRQTPLKDVVVQLLLDSPTFRKGRESFYAYAARGDASWTRRLPVLAGSEDVRLLAWSNAGLDVKVGGLTPAFAGKGDRYRVYAFAKPAPGGYDVEVSSKGPAEMIAFARCAYRAGSRLAAERTGPGGSVDIEVALLDAAGKPLQDAELARGARGTATMTPPGGKTQTAPLSFGDGPAVATTFRHTLPADADTGTYKYEFKLAVRLPEAPEEFLIDVAAVGATAVALPAYEIAFDRAEAFTGQPAAVIVKPRKGNKPLDHDPIDVRLSGDIKDGGPALKLMYDAKLGGWSAPYSSATPVTWSVTSGDTKRFFLAAGAPATLTVKPRAVRVLQNGQPVEKIVADVKYIEAGEYPLTITIDVDRMPDEQPAYAASFTGTKDVTFDLAARPSPVLKITTDGELPEQVGTLKAMAKVAGQELEKSVPVEVRFTDKSAKIFKKWLPWIIAAVVLILLAIWWALLARFHQQEVRPYLNKKLDTSYPLKAWGARSAVGTPESAKSLVFRMKGLSVGTPFCVVDPGRDGVKLLRADKPLEGRPPLKHCDEVTVADGPNEVTYFYFDHPPTDEEIKKLLAMMEDRDNLYLE